MVSEAPVVLREVRGPSALGGGRRRSLELLYLIAVTEFKRSYLGTALGYVWSLMRPLMLFAVLLLVFTQAFDLGSLVRNYPVLLLFNIVLFGFFQEATTQAVPSIVGQESVVRKTQFPRLVIPLAVVLTAAFNLAVNLVVVLVFLLASGIEPIWSWLLFPLVLVALVVFTAAVSMLLSALYPRFRDAAIIWSVAATALFYATPVLYPIELLARESPTLSEVAMANPLAAVIQQMRYAVIDSDAQSAGAAIGGAPRLIFPAAIVLGVFLAGLWIFNRMAPRVAEEL
jgi:ABC-2 type transport system permease protein